MTGKIEFKVQSTSMAGAWSYVEETAATFFGSKTHYRLIFVEAKSTQPRGFVPVYNAPTFYEFTFTAEVVGATAVVRNYNAK